MLLNDIRGSCMAMADSIPGVSRGTITFLLGLYDELISSFNDLMGKDNTRRKQAFIFLFRLDTGWTLGFCLSVLILSGLFQDYIYEISSIFMRLTLPTIPMVIREERHSMKERYSNLTFAFAGMALVFCISYFNPAGRQRINVSVEHLSLGLVVYMLIIIMVAITTMVLLGVPGSTPLLIFGIYVPVIGVVKEFLHMNLNHVPILVASGLDVITGTVEVIKLIRLCLERYHSQATYTIISLMTSSFYAITMGSITLGVSRDPMGPDTLRILLFPLGGLVLAGLEFMEIRLEKQ